MTQNQSNNAATVRQAGRQVAGQAGGRLVAQFFESNRSSIAAVLPKHVTPDRMLKIALGAIRNTPKLRECTTQSLFGAVVQCSQMGLEPNTVLGQAYLVPFHNKKEGRTDVNVILGYKGLIDLARRSGQIVSIAAHAVRERDEFDYSYGLEERLHHVPSIEGDRGGIVAFYAVAKLKDGGHQFEVLSKDGVDLIMRSTKTGGRFGPWKDHYEQMGRKTLIRRLATYLPLSVEFATASALDGMAESDKNQGMAAVLDGDYDVVEQQNLPENQPADSEALSSRLKEGPEGGGTVLDGEQVDKGTGEIQKPEGEIKWPQQYPDGQGGRVWVDRARTRFDQEKHSMGANGVPPVKKDGTFKARRGAGGATTAPTPTEEPAVERRGGESDEEYRDRVDLQADLRRGSLEDGPVGGGGPGQRETPPPEDDGFGSMD